MSEELEIWKPIPGYETLYEISSFGRVKSLRLKTSVGGDYFLALCKDRDGYLHVRLTDYVRSRSFLVHRLVLMTFIGPCPPKMVCRHYPDQNPANNNLNNLSWNTEKVNSHDRIENGTVNCGDQKGGKNGYAKLTEKDVLEIRKLESTGMYHREIAKMYNVSRENITSILGRKTWKHV